MPTSQPVTDTTLLDYIRISTYDSIQYFNLCSAIERKWSQWRPHKWLQYKGRKCADGIFHGIGDQNGRTHCVIDVSGSMAHVFYHWLAQFETDQYSTFYCTRIDLQRTQLQPAKEYRHSAYKRLSGSKSLITSDTGTTLYIGSRTSETFWRLYDKTAKHLRCEVELKGKLAKRSYVALQAGENLSGIFNRFLLRSRVPKVYADYFHGDGDIATIPDLQDEGTLEPQLKWLSTLDALVYKLLADHDTGERTRDIVARWTEYGQILDSGKDGPILK